MKNINTNKIVAGVAALGLSALLAGSVVAANVGGNNFSMNITKDTMYNNGVPSVSVVVGSMAQPVDVVWAGNIAAAIGKKAYVSTGTAGGASLQDVTIEVGSKGATTISGDGYLADNYIVNAAETTKTIDYTDYSAMYKKDTSADSDHAGASTLTIFDELSVNAKVFFNTNKDVKDLVASIDRGAITYTLDFDEGIKNNYTDSGASPRLRFNLMGVNYTVDSYDGTTLKLVQNLATQTYTAGNSFTVDQYTVELVSFLDTGANTNRYEVEMNLKDATGNIVETNVFRTGDTKIFDEYLTANIDVDTVYSSSVKLIMGSSGKLEFKNGQKINDFPNKGDKLWKATFTTSGSYLTKLAMTTDDTSLRYTNEDALRVGDKIELPLGFGAIEFAGLTSEKSTEFSIKDNYMYFTDADRKSHEVFFYDIDEVTTARDTYTTPELDGRPLYFKFYTSSNAGDANFTVQLNDSDGKYLVDGAVAGPAASWGTAQTFYTTGNKDINADTVGTTYTLELPLYNNTDRLVEYTLVLQPGATNVYSTVKTVAMGLKDNQTTDLYIGDTTYRWDIADVDVDGTDTSAFTDDSNMVGLRAPSAAGLLAGVFNNWIARDEFQSIARVKVYNATDKSIYSYIDAYTGDMVNLNDNDFTDTYKQVEYSDDNTNTFELDDKNNTTSLEFGYTTYGAYVSIEDGNPIMTLPEKQLKGQLFIGGGTTSSTTFNGGELVLTTPGSVVTTEDGKVSAKLVKANVSGSASVVAMTPANWNVNNSRLVYLDNESMSGAGAKIIVGGHLVNTLANGITNEYLTQAGQYVVGSTATGNVIVAGFTAADTADAARALITAIEALE